MAPPIFNGHTLIIVMLKTLLLVTALAFPLSSFAQLQPSRLISDGMVMQRGVEVPVWGWASPGTEVQVSFNDQTFATVTDAAGQWMVRLPALEAGGPYAMTIAGGNAEIHIQDILVGDVWIGSGQSNMEWVVADAANAEAEIAVANDPMIRHFKVPLSWALEPEPTLAGGTWEIADPEHVGQFTAVGYFFARELRKHVDVPIGLINTSWGGSRIEPWMSAGMLGLDAATLDTLIAQERAYAQTIRDNLSERFGGALPEHDAGLVDGHAVWADPSLDDSGWNSIPVPALWETVGYDGMDGIAWYRTSFDLTPEEAQADLRLSLGPIDDSDITWVNGHEVGRIEQAYSQPRVYTVPASVLEPGRNVIAVRVEDTGGGGGIYGAPDLLYLDVDGEHRSLAGTWRFNVGAVSINVDGRKNQIPMVLYNKMVHPLLPYPIKGVLWYQGESNAGPGDAYEYRTLFADLIEGWRAAWGQSDMPFLWVQLANYMAADDEPSESDWAVLRESQSATLAVPNTAQAVIIDIGDADDIHPRNKQDVGLRLALAARHVAYGEEDVVYSGPMYRDHEVHDGRVSISFDHVGGGLVAKGTDGAVHGFAIAGADGHFVWADARIEGDRVVVWSEQVPEPVAVRYAWGDNPETANLYNQEGLPASPFRTDSW